MRKRQGEGISLHLIPMNSVLVDICEHCKPRKQSVLKIYIFIFTSFSDQFQNTIFSQANKQQTKGMKMKWWLLMTVLPPLWLNCVWGTGTQGIHLNGTVTKQTMYNNRLSGWYYKNILQWFWENFGNVNHILCMQIWKEFNTSDKTSKNVAVFPLCCRFFLL